jgi:hypothetical protein
MAKGSFLNPGVQNLFTLGYFVSQDWISNGGLTVDEDKTYPTLASRNPQLQQSLDTDSMDGYQATNGRAGSESSEIDNYQVTANTRMNAESSDEDEDIAPIVQRVSLSFHMSTTPTFFQIHNLYEM